MAKKNSKINFKLLDSRINIKYVDNIESEDDSQWFGKTTYDFDKTYIQIATKDKEGNPISEATIESTLRHELFHVILDKLYFRDESANEKLVEWLAQATMILNKQGLNI